MHTPPQLDPARVRPPRIVVRPTGRSRGLTWRYRAAGLATVGLAAASLLAATAGDASAAPKPTIGQARARLSQLSVRADKLDQQYDQVQQELKSANQRLAVVNREAARYSARFRSMRVEIGRIAAQAYETGTLNSSMALLTSGRPQQILHQSSILLELSSANNAEMRQFIAAARQLTGARQAARRTRAGIAELDATLGQRRRALTKLIAAQKALVAQLTPVQQTGAGPGGGTSTGSGGGDTYTGPTSSQADKAVAFAYAQIGKPYVYGATGPDSYDCSGLMMASWAAAGISIPRISYDQMSDLPSVSLNNLQPGDILGFAGNSHVGMYVGNGEMIDAPHTGLDVEKVPLSGWYQSELDGAVRP